MKDKCKKLKDILIFLLLTIWIIIPILKELSFIETEITFVYIIGMIGIYLFIFRIYRDFINTENKKEFFKINLPIFIFFTFMLWTFISAMFAADKELAFYGGVYRKEGYLTYLSYLGFFGLAYLLDSKKLKRALLNIFILVAVVNIIFMLLANNGCFVKVLKLNDIMQGVFHNTNHYGYYLLLVTCISSLLFVYEKNKYIKVLYLFAYTFLVYFLILNNTFGVYLAFISTLILFLFYCIHKKTKIILSAITIIIMIIMSLTVQNNGENVAISNVKSFQNDIKRIAEIVIKRNKSNENIYDKNEEVDMAGSGRMKLWKYGMKFVIERPILGYGPENIWKKYQEENINQDRPHNLLIQLATTSGIPGLILYTTAICIILIRAIKTMNEKNSIHIIIFFAVVAYLISAMFGNSMYYTSPYFFILIGFLMCENIKIIDTKS